MVPDKHVLLVCEDKRSARVVKALFELVLRSRDPQGDRVASTRNPAAHPSEFPSWIAPRHAVEQVKRAGVPLFGRMRAGRGLDPQVVASSRLARLLGSRFAIFVLDSDRHPERAPEIREAAVRVDGTPVCAGVAIPEIESWLLAVASDEVRAALRKSLQFDPVREPHRMSSTVGGSRDAKAVFDQAYDDEQSALDRLERSDVDGLRREGAPSGLGEFMDALATRGLDAWSQG